MMVKVALLRKHELNISGVYVYISAFVYIKSHSCVSGWYTAE